MFYKSVSHAFYFFYVTQHKFQVDIFDKAIVSFHVKSDSRNVCNAYRRKNIMQAFVVYYFPKVVIEGHCLLLLLIDSYHRHAHCTLLEYILNIRVHCITSILAVAASIIADNKCNLTTAAVENFISIHLQRKYLTRSDSISTIIIMIKKFGILNRRESCRLKLVFA